MEQNRHTSLTSTDAGNRIGKMALDQAVISGLITPETTIPLVVRPAKTSFDLASWVTENRDHVEADLLEYGAVLFRDCNIASPETFERFALRISSELFNENGEHPRESVSGNVYTPVFFPPARKLLWHNENSFNYRWPMKIMFACQTPAEHGGETTIVDSRKVFQRIDPKIRKRFMEKNVMYVRNYGEGLGLPWQTVFRTDSKAEVEDFCRKNFMDFEWTSGDGFRTKSVRPAVTKHPKTGQYSWFNQAQHWHPACLDANTRASLQVLFKEEDFPRHCYLGDGSAIEDSIMDEICGVYAELEVCFPWQTGDVIVIDNMLTAHARNPFSGTRKILVALAELTSFSDLNE